MNKQFEFYKRLVVNDQLNTNKEIVKTWDLVVITAISFKQKCCYENQIKRKLEQNKLPPSFKYLIFNDPDGCKIGSGGSTINVINSLYELYGDNLYSLKILLIHAGGYR
jgi:fucokinase